MIRGGGNYSFSVDILVEEYVYGRETDAPVSIIYRSMHRWPSSLSLFRPVARFLATSGSVSDLGRQNPPTICNFPLGMAQQLQQFLSGVPRSRPRGKRRRRRVQDKSRTVRRFERWETRGFSSRRFPGKHAFPIRCHGLTA